MSVPFKSSGWVTLIGSMAVLVIWSFPNHWYNRTDANRGLYWLAEQTHIAGWNYQEIPIAKSAEKVLVADSLVNGAYSGSTGSVIGVFSAKRYNEDRNDIGLFVHTPDRCWTEAGWKIERVKPDWLELKTHGIPMIFERRVFTAGNQRELVYFGGLVGGQPLPYRLDHNLSVALRYQLKETLDKSGTALRAADKTLWKRVWESFTSRRPLLGPKQFIRINTPVTDHNLDRADQLLQEFLPLWLKPVDYDAKVRF